MFKSQLMQKMALGCVFGVVLLLGCQWMGATPTTPPLTVLPLMSPLSAEAIETINCQVSDFPASSGEAWFQEEPISEVPRLVPSRDLVTHYLGTGFRRRVSQRPFDGVACHVFVYESNRAAQLAVSNFEACLGPNETQPFVVALGQESCGFTGQIFSVFETTSADLVFKYEQIVVEIRMSGSFSSEQAQLLATQLAEHVYERLLSYTVAP